MLKNIYIFILFILLTTGCASTGDDQTGTSGSSITSSGQDRPVVRYPGFMLNCREDRDYGMYSYLLVSHEPVNVQYDNFIETIKFFIIKTIKLAQQNHGADERYINNTYVPLWAPPPKWVTQVRLDNPETLDSAARWVVQNYDYQCARKLTQKIEKLDSGNIYLLSSLVRLTDRQQTSIIMSLRISDNKETTLFQLLEEFYKKTWHQRIWNENTIKRIAKLLSLSMQGKEIPEEFEVPVSDFLTDTEGLVIDESMDNSPLKDAQLKENNTGSNYISVFFPSDTSQ